MLSGRTQLSTYLKWLVVSIVAAFVPAAARFLSLGRVLIANTTSRTIATRTAREPLRVFFIASQRSCFRLRRPLRCRHTFIEQNLGGLAYQSRQNGRSLQQGVYVLAV